MVKNGDLLERLRALGFPLLETGKTVDANRALADLVKSGDLRLWEGFPVVLANSAKKNLFNYEKTLRYLKESHDKSVFESLAALSVALYETQGQRFSWADQLYDFLNARAKREKGLFLRALKKNRDFKVGGREMSTQRVKTDFQNYFAEGDAALSELLLTKEEFGLEYALSQVFSPKQKELFLKKLNGEKMNKTEKEYFSRAVKKKVMALANTELHRLSRKLLE